MTERESLHPRKPTVLVVDDEIGHPRDARDPAAQRGLRAAWSRTAASAGLEAHRAQLSPDIVLTDVRMPQVAGVEVLAAARAHDPDVPVILMTAQATLQTAMQAVNEGAFYYIQKPFRNDELVAILRRAAEHRQLRVENTTLKKEIRRRDNAGERAPDRRQSRSGSRSCALAEAVAAHRVDGADHRRVGHRQGSRRPLHPRPVEPCRGTVPLDQLRRPSRRAARERAVRSREGIVHRRGHRDKLGTLHRRRRRHVLPRRDRRDDAARRR